MTREQAGAPGRRAGPLRHVRRAVFFVFAIVLLGAVGSGAWLFSAGWRVSTVGSPSMSPAIPVGAFVVSRPLSAPARIGQVIVFHPPGDTHIYIHRVVATDPGPTYRTKGDNDSLADPWTVPEQAVVGRVVAEVPDLGWLILGAPLLGAAVVAAAVLGLLFPRWRRWAVLDCACGALSLISFRLHPFVRWQVITVTHEAGKARVWLFNTGVLPIRVKPRLGRAVDVAPGHSAIITSQVSKHMTLAAAAHLTRTEWVIAAVVCVLPLVAAALAAWLSSPDAADVKRHTDDRPAAPVRLYPAGSSVTMLYALRVKEACSCPPGPCWFDGACRWSTRASPPTFLPSVAYLASARRSPVDGAGSASDGEQIRIGA